MYVKIDGTIYNFCKNKCHKNLIDLRRIPRRTGWTQPHMREKSSQMAGKGKKAPKKGAKPKKVRKPRPPPPKGKEKDKKAAPQKKKKK